MKRSDEIDFDVRVHVNVEYLTPAKNQEEQNTREQTQKKVNILMKGIEVEIRALLIKELDSSPL